MVLKSKKDETFSGGGLYNTLAPGTVVKGDIQTEGDFRLDGNIEGSITSGAKIVIGPNGYIKGNVIAANAEILGTVIGNIQISSALIIKASACIDGDIFTQTLEIEPNARFSGACTMSGAGQE